MERVNLYISDESNQRVRKVAAATNIITTVVGSGASAYAVSQDGGQATSANFGLGAGVAVAGAGDLFIADAANYRIRKISARGAILFPTATQVGSIDGTDGLETLTINNIGNLPLSISATTSSTTNLS